MLCPCSHQSDETEGFAGWVRDTVQWLPLDGRVLNPCAMRACTRHSKDPNSLRIRLREQYGLTFDRDMILDFIYAFLIFIVGLDWIIKMGM